ncbi:hypothetical protein CJD36_019840 [Flavipsychrobacter stenotrophus]|uniref:DUF6046 domain-containing protein n=1 Tax=Flavipsychrobacter stenotrophus TaxID=2077091 RepID=A0A2S7SRX0_9BACT|nr:DUF6046 domain-containing protein [Flavipsychrobacter stenotrophus]PQJ09494.1 hypothetical protein CJD36_019840 [Flavipsychrobacter stenotrophus]
MSIQLSIAQLFSDVHGVDAGFEFAPVADVFSRKQYGDYGSPYYKKDQFGRDYYLPATVTFAGGGIVLPDGAVTSGLNVIWDLPFAVVAIDNTKTIIKTGMTEREGAVNQVVNINSYNINIKGLLIGKGNEYPEDLEKMLRDVFVSGSAMALRNVKTDIYLNGMGYNVIVESINIPAHPGVQHVVGYDLRLTSNSIFDLEEIG